MTKQRIRRRLATLCARLAAFLEESKDATQALQLLTAGYSLPAADPSAATLSLVEVITRDGGQAIGEYMANAQAASLAPKALHFLSTELAPAPINKWSGWLVGTEFVLLIAVTLMYAIFVFPAYQSLFEGFGADLPGLTRFMIALFSPTSVFVWALCVIGIVALVWRTVPALLGPLTPVCDRFLMALPEVGKVLRTRNADALAGWLGHAGRTDREAVVSALRAAIEYEEHGVTVRACRRLRSLVDQRLSLFEALRHSNDFDREINATVAATEANTALDLAAALRARWRAGRTIRSRSSIRAVVFAQLIIGVLVALAVAALYLPIFQIGSFF